MNKVVFVREIDDLGRIVIPREYRNSTYFGGTGNTHL